MKNRPIVQQRNYAIAAFWRFQLSFFQDKTVDLLQEKKLAKVNGFV